MRWRRRLKDFLHQDLFLAAGLLYGHTHKLFALDPETGRFVWKQPLVERISGSDGSPYVSDGRLFYGDAAGLLWCLDARSGEILWSRLPEPIEKSPINGVPVTHDDAVIVPTITGFTVCYDVVTGEERWRQALGPCAARLAIFEGSILVPTNSSLCLVDPTDGGFVRRWSWEGKDVRHCVVAGDVIVAVVHDRKLMHRDPDAAMVGMRDREEIYRCPCPRRLRGLAWAAETDLLYETRHDGLGILDPATGERLFDLMGGVERRKGRLMGGAWPSVPDVRDGVLYLLTDDARVSALRHPDASDAERSATRRPIAGPAWRSVSDLEPLSYGRKWADRLRDRLGAEGWKMFDASSGGPHILDDAEKEARALGHTRIGTEHLLLGAMSTALGLTLAGVKPEPKRADVEALVGHGPGSPDEPLLLSERAVRAIQHTLEACHRFGLGSFLGDELLLGIDREPTCTALAVCQSIGISLDAVRLSTQADILHSWLWRLPVATAPGLGDEDSPDACDEYFTSFTSEARAALRTMKHDALQREPRVIAIEHLLHALFRSGTTTAELLRMAGSTIDRLRQDLDRLITATPDRLPGWHPRGDGALVTHRVGEAIEAAAEEAVRRKQGFLGPEHLLLGLVRQSEGIDAWGPRQATIPVEPLAKASSLLERLGVDPAKLRGAIERRLGGSTPP